MSGHIYHQTTQAHDLSDDQEKAWSQPFLWMAYETKKRLQCKKKDVQTICICNIPRLKEKCKMSDEDNIPSSLKKIWEVHDNYSLSDNDGLPIFLVPPPIFQKKLNKVVSGYSQGSKPRVSNYHWSRFEAKLEVIDDVAGELRNGFCVSSMDTDDELVHLMEIMKDTLHDLHEVISNKMHDSSIDEDEL